MKKLFGEKLMVVEVVEQPFIFYQAAEKRKYFLTIFPVHLWASSLFNPLLGLTL